MAIYPTAEQFQELMKGPQDQPVVMLNLLRFKKRADASSHEGDTGQEAYMRYGAEMRKFVESKGGRFIWLGRVDSQLIGEGGEEFDAVGLVEYPSRKAFAEIAQDPFVTENIGKHRAAGLDMQWLIAMTEAPTDR